MSLIRNVNIGDNDLAISAWGEAIVAQKYSLASGLFTFFLDPRKYKKLLNDVEIQDGSLDTFIRSERGKLVVSANVLSTRHTIRTTRAMKYQPNRGHVYSDSVWIPNAGNGTLNFVIRNKTTSNVVDEIFEITDLPADISKGNVYDISFQWRGAGNFKFFSNLIQRAVREVLGTTTELTITNPTLPVAYEATKGGSVIGGETRIGSTVRWGLFTPENGVFFEWEYEDNRDPQIEVGCWDVSSQGGGALGLSPGFATAADIGSSAQDSPGLAVRIPLTRNVNGDTWINTISSKLSQVGISQADENNFKLYITRDPTAVVDTGTVGWQLDELTQSVEFLINDSTDATQSFTFDETKATLLFNTRAEQDQPERFNQNLLQEAPFWLNPGDYLIFTNGTNGTDIVSNFVRFGAEI